MTVCTSADKTSLPLFLPSTLLPSSDDLTTVLISLARMPAILDGEEAVSKWLDFGEVSAQEALKLIHPTENIAFHPVSTVVNNFRNDTPECLLPADLLVKKVTLSFLSFLSSISMTC